MEQNFERKKIFTNFRIPGAFMRTNQMFMSIRLKKTINVIFVISRHGLKNILLITKAELTKNQNIFVTNVVKSSNMLTVGSYLTNFISYLIDEFLSFLYKKKFKFRNDIHAIVF